MKLEELKRAASSNKASTHRSASRWLSSESAAGRDQRTVQRIVIFVAKVETACASAEFDWLVGVVEGTSGARMVQEKQSEVGRHRKEAAK